MSLTYGPQVITGLAVDVKPLNVLYGVQFVETDTGNIFWRVPDGWRNLATIGKHAPGVLAIYANSFARVCDFIELGAGESVTIDAGSQLRID